MAGLTQHTINTPYMVGPVHCYSGMMAGELVLFDTGPPTPETERYLRKNIDLANLRHVIVTHCHIDHYGQAHWLEQHSDATIYLPYRDCLKISEHDRRMEDMYRLLMDLGFSREYLTGLKQIFDSGALFPPFPKRFKVAEKELLDRLGIEVISCPGHSQSDLVYAGEDWAVTGDTLLRGIFQSPLLDVDLESGDRFNNYAAYCSSLVKLAGLRNRKVLPGHRQTIAGIDATLLFYVSKLLVRVEQLRPFKDEENLMVLIDKLLGDRVQDTFHLFLKASEVVFMKDLLGEPEMLRRALEEIGLFGQVDELYHAATGC
ncbi:MAG: NADH:flavin oxidoreductase/NADH oxidase [uncultured bacterium]|nr:MAG: NADH:flavin oxidoreductase/NADH oxidase [uncultured bacterium]